MALQALGLRSPMRVIPSVGSAAGSSAPGELRRCSGPGRHRRRFEVGGSRRHFGIGTPPVLPCKLHTVFSIL